MEKQEKFFLRKSPNKTRGASKLHGTKNRKWDSPQKVGRKENGSGAAGEEKKDPNCIRVFPAFVIFIPCAHTHLFSAVHSQPKKSSSSLSLYSLIYVVTSYKRKFILVYITGMHYRFILWCF